MPPKPPRCRRRGDAQSSAPGRTSDGGQAGRTERAPAGDRQRAAAGPVPPALREDDAHPDQLQLALEDLEQAIAEGEAKAEKTDPPRQAARRQQRRVNRGPSPTPAAGRGGSSLSLSAGASQHGARFSAPWRRCRDGGAFFFVAIDCTRSCCLRGSGCLGDFSHRAPGSKTAQPDTGLDQAISDSRRVGLDVIPALRCFDSHADIVKSAVA